ncbi:DUF106 domain-containing protein [Candidatus Micrarchaeota archaeon]|nr:DUF106 domain-containing protein [Candidatus Micrarchaeota archaeon]
MFEYYIYLVAVLAMGYAGIALFIQNKFVDRKKMNDVQQKSNALNAELKIAQKNNDKKKMDQIMEKQMELFPEMNNAMMGSMKVSMVVLVVFLLVAQVLTYLDPFIKDDQILLLKDDGVGCDKFASDGVYSGCFTNISGNYTSAIISGKIIKKGFLGFGEQPAGTNITQIYFDIPQQPDPDIERSNGGEIPTMILEKQTYTHNENIRIELKPKNNDTTDIIKAEAVFDNGSAFAVDLPVAIPINGEKRIHQPYWWFILISVICNLCGSMIMGRITKTNQKKNEQEEDKFEKEKNDNGAERK